MKSVLQLSFHILFYAIHVVALYFWLIWSIGYQVQQKCLSFWGCARYISYSSLGYGVDLADGQWREFRNSLPLLFKAMIGISIVYFVYKTSLAGKGYTVVHISWFRVVVGLVVLFIQHGLHSLIILTIAYLGFCIFKMFRGYKYIHPMITWIFALAVLFFKESYRWKHLPGFQFLAPLFDKGKYGALYGWQLPANFLVLRMVSYSMDSHWSLNKPSVPAPHPVEKGMEEKKCPFAAPKTTQVSSDYDAVHYCAYLLYCPLYMAGPIITFNDYMKYTHTPQTKENTLHYAIRWVIAVGLLELLTSQFPFFGVVASGMLPHLSISEIAVVFYVLLKLMWLKFLVIWRFFRLWALMDGVCPPENMTRCMSNNRSLEGFWKGWHSSYNLWLVRYLYKPLGGRGSRVWSVWLIFLFVALWHDLEWKLILWGLLNGFFYVVEVYARRLAETSVMQSLPSTLLHMVVVLSGATYILVLIAVNLIGYGAGVGWVSVVQEKLLSVEGYRTLFVSYYFLCIGVKLMMFIEELRNGDVSSLSVADTEAKKQQ